MKNPGGGGYPNTSAASFASVVICATWRLHPLWAQSIAHTSRHHRGVPPTCFRFLCVCGRSAAGEVLFFLGGFYQEHDEHAAGGGDAQDAEELGEVLAQLREFHPVEYVHAEQQRAENDRDHADEDQECPQHGCNRLCRKVAPKLRRTPREHKQKSASRHPERIGASELSTNNCGLSTVSGGGEGRLGAAEAVDDALAAEDHHGIEERRGHGLAHDGH